MREEPDFGAAAHAILDDLVAVRRELHATPEVGLELPHTQQLIVRELAALGLEVSTGTRLSSVTAVLRGAHPGPTVLLRGDMDGLPIVEDTGLSFAATTGTMHACGHDLHMAGLVGAARILSAHRDELAGSIIFMFQPGEEGFAGGRIMIEEGVLASAGERPVAAFALHVDCLTPRATVVTRPGPIMASASGLNVVVRGTGGHAAYPQVAVDPVPVAAELILAMQSFQARRLPAVDQAVISVTTIRSDSEAPNVLASAVYLEANIRTLSTETLDTVREHLPELLRGIAQAHGCTFAADFVESYPVTHNDPDETAFALEVLDELVGAERMTILPAPSMASEDFAYVLSEIPGALVFVGAAPSDAPSGGMHSPLARFDDSVLALQAEILATLAWRRLQVQASGVATRSDG